MKTKKLNLNDLKVESFVTSLEGKESQTVKGGVLPELVILTVSVATFVAVSGYLLAEKLDGKKEECKK